MTTPILGFFSNQTTSAPGTAAPASARPRTPVHLYRE
jgi:hypothetical protein